MIHDVITLPSDNILYVRVVIGAILVLMYAYNIGKSWAVWRRQRDWDSYREFIMAFELVFGVTLIFTGYITAAFFADNKPILEALRTIGLGLLGVLLVGGFTLVLSWRKPSR